VNEVTPSGDWFPETFTGLDAVTLRALSRRDIVSLIAAARLIGCISPTLRGDGRRAGYTSMVRSIPVLFVLELDHNITKPVAEIARLVKNTDLLARIETLISQEEIDRETVRLAKTACHNFRVASKLLEAIAEEGLRL
jgi:hypothetical protein